MPFGTATVVTSSGKAIAAKRHIGATPAQAEPNYIGIGTGATAAGRTAAAGDTSLSTPVESRVAGTSSTVTTTVTNDTYQTVGTITASAARAVDEAGTFDASTAGNMDVSATFAVVNLQSGDSLQLTIKKQFQ
jgi:ribose 5-phosphate isomerase